MRYFLLFLNLVGLVLVGNSPLLLGGEELGIAEEGSSEADEIHRSSDAELKGALEDPGAALRRDRRMRQEAGTAEPMESPSSGYSPPPPSAPAEPTEAVEPMESPDLPPVNPGVDGAIETATEAVTGEAPDLAPESEPRWLRLGLPPPKRRPPEPLVPVAVEGSIIKTPAFIFEPWSTNLSDQDRAVLEKIAIMMKEQPEAIPKLKIASYTDNSGDPAINEALTIARANVVKAYLILKGVGVHRLEAHGFGDANPLVSNETKEGRAQNRRVEFEILK